jgi:murein DD-endopeptidase MepM/ murein hydrolase activator NlpD
VAGRQSILIGFIAVLAVTGSTGAPSATSAGRPSAKAIGIQVSVPGQGGGSVGVVTGPPDAVGVGGSFAYPADGSIAQAASVSSSVTGVSGATTTASASVEVSGLSLFGGEITVGSITARGSARAGGGVTGEASGSAINGAVVLGQSVGPGQTVAYGSWGTVTTLQQYGTPIASGFQTRVTGLSVHLNADHAGAPAGTDILVGYVDVTAEAPPAPKPKPKPKPKPPTTTTTDAGKPTQTPKDDADPRLSVPRVREIPFNVFPKLTAGGYVFPVYGSASYTNTFGAPRANTGWHHGEDIFAPLGAPILAVANGIVYSVGWNDIGGLRLWLQDRAGNEFYYAHLSAFSPLAVNGAQVRAGDVLGFMGNTGDAEATPYHLHFEIHPAALLYEGYDGVVAPYPYLNAWRRLQDLPLTGVASGWAPPISDSSDAPKPGAILLQTRDISNGTGLEPGSLRRAMRPSGPAVADDGSLAGTAAEGRERPPARSVSLGRP